MLLLLIEITGLLGVKTLKPVFCSDTTKPLNELAQRKVLQLNVIVEHFVVALFVKTRHYS
jgi:hypothetical protein